MIKILDQTDKTELLGKINEKQDAMSLSMTYDSATGSLKLKDGNTVLADVTVQSGGASTTKTLKNIAVTTQPTKTAYKVNENFDISGMVITATYDVMIDGIVIGQKSEAVTGYTVSPNAISADITSATVSYTKDGVTKTDSVSVTVVTLDSIAITTQPSNTTYYKGAVFDKTGMVVTGTYSDGSTEVLTGYTYEPSGALATTDTSVTVSYGGKSASISITVEGATNGYKHVLLNDSGKTITITNDTEAEFTTDSLKKWLYNNNYNSIDNMYTNVTGFDGVYYGINYGTMFAIIVVDRSYSGRFLVKKDTVTAI